MIDPTIQGLNPRQLSIANLLWSCDSQDQVETLIKGLPTDQDRMEAASIVQIMIHECMEEEIEDNTELADTVNRLIDSVR